MKNLIKLLFLILPVSAVPFVDSAELLIRSRESKNFKDEAVHNKIQLIEENSRDIWMMNQSHEGLSAPAEKWDRVAIVVDKSQTPHRAKFYQLEPGPLEWSDQAKRVPYTVSCYLCHSNGPRQIRPDFGLQGLNLKERAKLAIWNMKIKSYGHVVADDSHADEDKTLQVPFRWKNPKSNEVLRLKVCQKCHNDQDRAALTKQNFMSIKFLVESGEMPPNRTLSEEDKDHLNRFLEDL